MPCANELNFRGIGNSFDPLIAGWVQYWNEVLSPPTALDPNLVKALIASESSFKPKKLADSKKLNSARGLLQITNATRKILGDGKGELKDHFVTVSRDELNDPNVNICAGVRWLFQKQKLASGKLGHAATWLETLEEYKGNSKATKSRAEEIMGIFTKHYETLKKCKK
jgi:hypothetical protein